MMMSFEAVKAALARGEQAATAEVQAFISWLEGKNQQLEAAKTLLENNGFTVTLKQ